MNINQKLKQNKPNKEKNTMKKLIVLFILVAMATTVFGQITSSDLLKERSREIQVIDKNLRKSAPRGAQVDQSEREKLVAKVDSLYQPLILAAMGRESATTATPVTPATPTTKKLVTYSEIDDSTGTKINSSASSETPINLPPPVPTPANRRANGSTVAYQGDQGAFSGNSPSVIRGADAYATVATADANAYLVRQMAKGVAATVSAPTNQVGLEGIIINKYRFQELEVKIVGTNPGNVYNKTFLLGRDQSITDYLLPGTYQATIKAIGLQGPPVIHNFVVAPHQTHSINGRNVFWGLYGGSSR